MKRLIKKSSVNDLEQYLKSKNVSFTKNGDSYDLPDIGGTILDLGETLDFIHSNQEPEIKKSSPIIEAAIDAYLAGFDKFEEFLKAHKSEIKY